MKRYDKSEIMRKAWKIFREKDYRSIETVTVQVPCLNGLFEGDTMPVQRRINTFAAALRYAWREAKRDFERDLVADVPRVAEIDKSIFILKMKDTWSREDFEYSDQLYAEREKIVKELLKTA